MGKKKLCNWSKKKIKKDLEELSRIVEAPTKVCKKCGRVAGNPAYLCKPIALKG